MDKKYLAATDMGGTFVDAIVWDLVESRYFLGKAPSTPKDPPRGVFEAIASAAHRGGLTAESVFANTVLFLNGTTVTTNAMIEHRGASTGLLTTTGFEDMLEIARVMGRTIGLDEVQLLDYRRAKAPPRIVPRSFVRGVVERIDARGQVVCPLDVEQAMAAADDLVAKGVEALAISLLWSFRNPSHERTLRDLIEKRHPQLFVVASSDLAPVLGEYERTNTTVINAFLGQNFGSYSKGLRTRIRATGSESEPLIMQSVGGLAPARQVERIPVATLFSGPVGGVIASAKLGQMIGRKNLITADMGGTSFDVGMILDGKTLNSQQTVIERHLVAMPTVEVITIGAGGGSVAKVTDSGLLQVGPESMGALPGPACYLRGGTIPTVTDADVVLGFIEPTHFLGGAMAISRERSLAVIQEHIGEPMGLDAVESAAAVHEIVNAHMADLIRRVSVQRGHDPREFALVAFGGCGPVHGCALGAEIGTEAVVIPPAATAFSAMGVSQSDIRHTFVRSFPHALRLRSGGFNEDAIGDLNAALLEFSRNALSYLDEACLDQRKGTIHYLADIRYRNQAHGVLVPLRFQPPADGATLAALVRDFESQYERAYGAGSSSPRTPIEWISLSADVVVPTPSSPITQSLPAPAPSRIDSAAELGTHQMYSLARKRFESVPLYRAEKLRPGNIIDVQALIVSYGFTIPVHDGQTAQVDQFGNIVIRQHECLAGSPGQSDTPA